MLDLLNTTALKISFWVYLQTGDKLSSAMSDQLLYRPGVSIELNGTSGEAEEKIRPASISSPSSSSSSSSSLSWSKTQNNTYGISSESETSLEYLETPVTEEFKECTPKSHKIQTLEEASLSAVSDSLSLDTSINAGTVVSAIQRRSGYYGRRTKEERARLREEKIAAGAANQSLPLPLTTSSPAAPQVTATVASSYLDKVVQETVDTEKIYVKDLKDIIRVTFILAHFLLLIILQTFSDPILTLL